MRLKDWLICIVVALGVFAYLFFMPPYIGSGLQEDPYAGWVMPEKDGYTGILTVWHVVRFRPYSGSGGDWLKERAKEFEKKHYGVYVEVLSMTEEECAARFLRGETADLYSFPLGWGYAERFFPLEEQFPSLRERLLATGAQEGVQYAVPFLMSGYALVLNTRLAQERAVQTPESGVDAEWLNASAKKLTYEYGRKKAKMEGLSGSAVVSALLGARVPVADYELFKAQRAGMAVAELRMAGDLTRAQSGKNGFAFEAFSLFNYTDLVQYLGVARGIDERKLPYAVEFIGISLTEKAQRSLLSLNAFPVTETNDLSYEPPLVQETYEKLKNPVVPNAFLYERYKTALFDAASRALNDDEAGKIDFAARVTELVNGAEIK